MGILPVGGAYSFGLTPEFSLAFFGDAITYWWLPFWSIVLVFIGGQAVGMRSMAIYELGSDYVNYNRGLGVQEGHTVRYIFRNAMLPQITGLALAIAGIIAGALITELVFSYPGLGTLLFSAIGQNDYPVISAITLMITIAVLVANFAVDILTGFIDPRIRAYRAETADESTWFEPSLLGGRGAGRLRPPGRVHRTADRADQPERHRRRPVRQTAVLRPADPRHRQRGPERDRQPGLRHPHLVDRRPDRGTHRHRHRSAWSASSPATAAAGSTTC